MALGRRALETIVFIALLISYTLLSYMNNQNAELVGELLKMVTIAIVSYEFGRTDVAIEHVRKQYVRRSALIALGFGVALIVHHAIVFGGFDPIWEDPLGHEWIGLYIVIASMICLSLKNK